MYNIINRTNRINRYNWLHAYIYIFLHFLLFKKTEKKISFKKLFVKSAKFTKIESKLCSN